MRYIIAIILPPVGTLLFAGLLSTLLNVILCAICLALPFLLWIPSVHAVIVVARREHEKKMRKLCKHG